MIFLKMAGFRFLTGLSMLVLSLSLAWAILAPLDFLYPVWHDHAGISEGIERYGPKNRYKTGFAETTRDERIRVFSEINQSIHLGGNGLASIQYESSASQGPQLLLRAAEVEHLQDVANLLVFLAWIIAFNTILFCVLLSVYRRNRTVTFSSIKTFMGLGVGGGIVALFLSVIGPKTVFNQLHIWVFPDDHQWFFYYQDSLMSTMMLAPDLFAWIALALIALTVMIFAALTTLMNKFLNFV
ncbi:MAG: hypothetical protein ACI93R_001571 [Flavobacteriales bacterium]|jgi:hypothetical protein